MKGYVVLKYMPSGEVIRLPFGIKKLNYHNELVLSDFFGYDGGGATPRNNPENWRILNVSVEPEVKT